MRDLSIGAKEEIVQSSKEKVAGRFHTAGSHRFRIERALCGLLRSSLHSVPDDLRIQQNLEVCIYYPV